MRCVITSLIIIFTFCFSLYSEAQFKNDSLYTRVPGKDLPKNALKSKFRIQILVSEIGGREFVKNEAKEANTKFRLNAYILSERGQYNIQLGDYTEKKYAKQRASSIKKKYPKTKIVKTHNDSIVDFLVFEKKKPVNPAGNIVNKELSKKPYTITLDPPIRYSDTSKTQKIENIMANTAGNETYLSEREKQVYYYLNLVRLAPRLFAETYLSNCKTSKDPYESGLYSELLKLKTLPLLKPNQKLFESAKCHAIESGEKGYVGHDRFKCIKYFMGECCQYGVSEALDIVIDLLVDQGVSSLGHRRICLSPGYTELGVSIQPHKSYGVNAVLDFQ